MTITRSTGIDPGIPWGGIRPGGGYRGITEELDEVVAQAAERMAAEYHCDVEIRFNSTRKSGGAFRPDGLGITAGLRRTHEEWEKGRDADLAKHPDNAGTRAWWDNCEPKESEPPIYVTVYAPADRLLDPSLASAGSVGHRYACPTFDTLDEAFEWVRSKTMLRGTCRWCDTTINRAQDGRWTDTGGGPGQTRCCSAVHGFHEPETA